MIEPVHNEVDLRLGDGIEALLLGEVLTDEAVHVLVNAALPRRVGMVEIELGVEFLGDAGMPSVLLAIVRRQSRVIDAGLERFEQTNEAFADCHCGLVLDLVEQGKKRDVRSIRETMA